MSDILQQPDILKNRKSKNTIHASVKSQSVTVFKSCLIIKLESVSELSHCDCHLTYNKSDNTDLLLLIWEKWPSEISNAFCVHRALSSQSCLSLWYFHSSIFTSLLSSAVELLTRHAWSTSLSNWATDAQRRVYDSVDWSSTAECRWA